MRAETSASGTGPVLGIEGGATHTRALLVASQGHVLWQGSAGPGNLQLLSDRELRRLLRELRGPEPQPAAVAIGLAGARTSADQSRLLRVATGIWPRSALRATNDLETALAAGVPGRPARARAWILVLSGTGSCCFGQTISGQTTKVGGWGHILGDRGSSYAIGLSAVRRVLEELDRTGRWPVLGQRILGALLLNGPEDLVTWARGAEKHEVAALARTVFLAWNRGDRLAAEVVNLALEDLVRDAAAAAARLSARAKSTDILLAGGTFLGQDRLVARFRSRWRVVMPGCSVRRLERASVWGAVELARQLLKGAGREAVLESEPRVTDLELRSTLKNSPTEQRNPRSMQLHRMPLGRAVGLMLEEESKVAGALLKHRRALVRTIGLIVRALRKGGRLFYVGAGTSGRLGVLDASECPPTFRSPPGMVQAIMAGGSRALWDPVEGAEDDAGAGSRAVSARGVGSNDVVVGIAASGRTPFVWGALHEARRRRARTVLLCFNPRVQIAARARPDIVLAVAVGPEVLTGSTRLKAGTATKLVLNMLTTLSMVRLGKVHSNLMIDLKPTNAKLRARAMGIVRELTGRSEPETERALRRTGWNVKVALAELG